MNMITVEQIGKLINGGMFIKPTNEDYEFYIDSVDEYSFAISNYTDYRVIEIFTKLPEGDICIVCEGTDGMPLIDRN